MSEGVVRHACINYKRFGQVRNPRQSRLGKPLRQIPKDILDWIVSDACLEEFKFHSLSARCELIYAKFGLRLQKHGAGRHLRQARHQVQAEPTADALDPRQSGHQN